MEETKEQVQEQTNSTVKSRSAKKTNEQVQQTTVEVQQEKKEQRIYVGPGSVQLNQYTVVENEFPFHIQELIDKCPTIEKLFVPVTKFTEIEPKVGKKGTLEHRDYQKVVDFLNGKGE